jgi:tetratricopeptide (TPR) repeat protein
VAHADLREELHLAIAAIKSSTSQFRFDVLSLIISFVVFLSVAAAIAFTARYALADYHHRQALNAVAANRGLDAYNSLVQAERLNPYIDLYRVNLAQTNFALANAIAAAKGPTEASPSGSLTDQDKQNIQTLLSQAIAEGRVAVALSPRNAGNWEVLGAIYRQISGVAQNALAFALDSYGRAIQLDPLNPLLRLNAGGIYYSVKNYDLAVRFFSDAVQLKPDFANGWYNLAIALRDKGDLPSAQAAAERTVSLLEPQAEDYKIASELLADLKSKTATQSAQQGNQISPANPNNSALQNEELPNVVDLPKPDTIATPPAVRRTPAPSAQP